jgi:hypothetical protein
VTGPPAPAAVYHADPCERPSLSASIAALMCARSPRHAWAAHPKLNPDFERVDEQKFDVGTAAHALLLQGERSCRSSTPTTGARRRARKRATRRAPKASSRCSPTSGRGRADGRRRPPQLEGHDADPPLLADGKPEQTLVWEEDGVTCRAMLDWLHDDHQAIDDLKTTGRPRTRASGAAHVRDIGADVQVAFYLRGLRALTGARPEFRFVVVENAAVRRVGRVARPVRARARAARRSSGRSPRGARCLETDEWPAYPPTSRTPSCRRGRRTLARRPRLGRPQEATAA